jgi:ASCH domain-containing protein
MSFPCESLAHSEGVVSSNAPRLALSVRQPWAELILTGRKKIELRTWTTDHRGPLWSNIL